MDVAPLIALLDLFSRVLLALIFLQAAHGKLANRSVLPAIVRNYRLLPHAAVRPAAAILPIVEVLLAAALLSGPAPAAAAIAAAALLVLFAAAMGVNLMRGRREIDCGCFQSGLRQSLSWFLVGRNLVLAALAMLGVLGATVELDPASVVEAAVAGAIAFVLYNALNLLTEAKRRTHLWPWPQRTIPS